jgi:hypothetical protein
MRETNEHQDGVLIDPSEVRLLPRWVIWAFLALVAAAILWFVAVKNSPAKWSLGKSAAWSSPKVTVLKCTSDPTGNNPDEYVQAVEGRVTYLAPAGKCPLEWILRPRNGEVWSGKFILDPKQRILERLRFQGFAMPMVPIWDGPQDIYNRNDQGRVIAVQFYAGPKPVEITISTE